MPQPIPGLATPEGTARYAARHAARVGEGHFRVAAGLTLSSLGLGTYLGAPDEDTDRRVAAAARRAVEAGWNVLDTAINYRLQRGERALGAALEALRAGGGAARDELVVCSKAGFTPAEDGPAWFRETYLAGPSALRPSDLVAGCHCLHPDYLRDQLRRSLENLGLGALDVYHLHNPETQLGVLDRKAFRARLRAAFAALEGEVRAGHLGAYGLATWGGLRAPPGRPEHLSLEELKALAGEAAAEVGGGPDHLRFVQLPVNLGMPEALLATQELAGELVPALEAARALGLTVVASAALAQGRLLGRLPPALASKLGPNLTSDAQRVLQFARSTPGVTTALVGMKEPAHVDEDLALTALPPLTPEAFLNALQG